MNLLIRCFIIAVLALALLPLPCQADQKPEPDSSTDEMVSRIDVLVEDGGAKSTDLQALARGLISLKEQEPFSSVKFENSLDALKRTHLFRAIDVADPVKTSSGFHLTFKLTAYYRIRDIKIQGAFPLLEKKILTAMSIYVGDAFVPLTLKNQEGRIRDIYKKEGYPEPVVRVSADLGDPEKGVVVNVSIVKGRFYYIRKCTVEGNQSFFSIRLKLRTHLYKASYFYGDGRRLIQEKLTEDISNLTRFYRQRGYPDVKITSETEIVEKKKSVNVRIIIDEGPYYAIKFKGNHAFWDYTLNKDFDFAGRGNAGDITLKRGLKAIRERYRLAGFPDAWVSMESETAKNDGREVRNITITVEEGYRLMVAGIAFSGNKAVGEKELRKDVLSRPSSLLNNGAFVTQTLSDDVEALAALYRRKGFAHVRVKESVEWETDKEKKIKKAHIRISVTEGPQSIISLVRFKGLVGLNHEDAFQLLTQKEGGVYSEVELSADEKKLSKAISEKGYPHVTVKSRVRFNDNRSAADIVFDVVEGPYVEVGEIVYLGNFITHENIFKRDTDLKQGDYFSLVKYLEAQRNMRDINALNSVDFKEFGLMEKESRVNILTSVEEKKPYYFQAAIGYDTTQNKYVKAKLGDRNLFGLNKEAWISQEVSDIGYRTETGVTEPRFLGTRISSTLRLYSEKIEELNADFGTVTYGSSLNLSREFSNKITTALAFSYDFKDLYQKDSDMVSQSEKSTYDGRHTFGTTPSISYNSTDSFIRPRKGLYTIFSVKFSNALGDAPDDFLRYQAQARYYYSPLSFLTLALRARYGYLEPIAVNSDIPDDELFFLGGATDVRGFDENLLRFDSKGDPVGGREFFAGSVEARIDVGLNFEITCFYDAGRISKTNTDEGDAGMRSSIGTGLRYVTPIGPVGLLYGWKTAPKENEASGNLHFTIGYSF